MAVQVMNREAELERLVRERTAELVAKNEALEAAQRQMEEELTAAQALQAAILPHRFEPEATHAVSAYMMPAQHMGGDFYDVFRIDEHRYGFAIADVAGKGIWPRSSWRSPARSCAITAARACRPASACCGRTRSCAA